MDPTPWPQQRRPPLPLALPTRPRRRQRPLPPFSHHHDHDHHASSVDELSDCLIRIPFGEEDPALVEAILLSIQANDTIYHDNQITPLSWNVQWRLWLGSCSLRKSTLERPLLTTILAQLYACVLSSTTSEQQYDNTLWDDEHDDTRLNDSFLKDDWILQHWKDGLARFSVWRHVRKECWDGLTVQERDDTCRILHGMDRLVGVTRTQYSYDPNKPIWWGVSTGWNISPHACLQRQQEQQRHHDHDDSTLRKLSRGQSKRHRYAIKTTSTPSTAATQITTTDETISATLKFRDFVKSYMNQENIAATTEFQDLCRTLGTAPRGPAAMHIITHVLKRLNQEGQGRLLEYTVASPETKSENITFQRGRAWLISILLQQQLQQNADGSPLNESSHPTIIQQYLTPLPSPFHPSQMDSYLSNTKSIPNIHTLVKTLWEGLISGSMDAKEVLTTVKQWRSWLPVHPVISDYRALLYQWLNPTMSNVSIPQLRQTMTLAQHLTDFLCALLFYHGEEDCHDPQSSYNDETNELARIFDKEMCLDVLLPLSHSWLACGSTPLSLYQSTLLLKVLERLLLKDNVKHDEDNDRHRQRCHQWVYRSCSHLVWITFLFSERPLVDTSTQINTHHRLGEIYSQRWHELSRLLVRPSCSLPVDPETAEDIVRLEHVGSAVAYMPPMKEYIQSIVSFCQSLSSSSSSLSPGDNLPVAPSWVHYVATIALPRYDGQGKRVASTWISCVLSYLASQQKLQQRNNNIVQQSGRLDSNPLVPILPPLLQSLHLHVCLRFFGGVGSLHRRPIENVSRECFVKTLLELTSGSGHGGGDDDVLGQNRENNTEANQRLVCILSLTPPECICFGCLDEMAPNRLHQILVRWRRSNTGMVPYHDLQAQCLVVILVGLSLQIPHMDLATRSRCRDTIYEFWHEQQQQVDPTRQHEENPTTALPALLLDRVRQWTERDLLSRQDCQFSLEWWIQLSRDLERHQFHSHDQLVLSWDDSSSMMDELFTAVSTWNNSNITRMTNKRQRPASDDTIIRPPSRRSKVSTSQMIQAVWGTQVAIPKKVTNQVDATVDNYEDGMATTHGFEYGYHDTDDDNDDYNDNDDRILLLDENMTPSG